MGMDFEPIPLSEEILLKVGFEKSNIHGYANYDNDSISILLNDGYFQLIGYERRLEIKYLHQLQNLYFALTGQELNTSGLINTNKT